MENLSGWLLIFAGAIIGLLGVFLLAAERELKNKRRELEGLKSQLRGNQTNRPLDPSTEAQHSETHPSAELMTRNQELAERISALSSRLEESQRTVNELQTAQRILASAESENQQLHETILNLQDQLQASETLLNTTASQHEEIANSHSQMQSELAELNRHMNKLTMKNNELLEEIDSLSSELTASRRTVEDLRTMRQSLSDTQAENERLRAVNQGLQQESANINEQLRTSESRFCDLASEARETADRNSKLQTEVFELKQQLQKSQKTIEELQIEQQRLGSVQFENERLRQEIAILGDRLQTSETRLSESARQLQEAMDRYARLQTEVADLEQQVEESQRKARELETVQQQLANTESREVIFRGQQHNLEVQIADLQRELSLGKEQIQELDATHKRLAEVEHVCQQLREGNRQLEEENSRWQERLAASEENQRQLGILRQQLHELQTKQAPLLDGYHQFQTEPTVDGELIDGASRRTSDSDLAYDLQSVTNTLASTSQPIEPAAAPQANGIPLGVAVSEANTRIDDLGEDNGGHTHGSSTKLAATLQVASEEKFRPGDQTLGKRQWRFAIVPAMVILTIAAAVAVGFLGTSSDKFVSASKEPAAEFEIDSGALTDAASKTPKEFSKQTAGTKPAPRLRGAFKTTRPTQVYSGPSDNSPLIANIGPGMKINVVDSRDGWLEIRSKHGRPPGFIRQEAAVRSDQNPD